MRKTASRKGHPIAKCFASTRNRDGAANSKVGVLQGDSRKPNGARKRCRAVYDRSPAPGVGAEPPTSLHVVNLDKADADRAAVAADNRGVIAAAERRHQGRLELVRWRDLERFEFALL